MNMERHSTHLGVTRIYTWKDIRSGGPLGMRISSVLTPRQKGLTHVSDGMEFKGLLLNKNWYKRLYHRAVILCSIAPNKNIIIS